MLTSQIEQLREKMPELELRQAEPLKNHSSFRIGGPAAAMLFPKSLAELTQAVRLLRELDVRPFVMGNGSNLLFADEGYNGVIIKTTGLCGITRLGESRIRAESGALLSRTAVFAAEQSLTGLEFAHGIPGSVGGAMVMNAGAYGGEMKDVAVKTVYLDSLGIQRMALGADQALAYRRSRFGPYETVLYTEFELQPGREEDIRAVMADLAQRRRDSQPLNLPSAGSAFKRPATGYAAAMIDRAGLKGLRVGGAQVSEKHAGFIVNTGDASCADVLALIDKVREAVLRAEGVELEPEIRVVPANGG